MIEDKKIREEEEAALEIPPTMSQEEIDIALRDMMRKMKRRLKPLSKSKLIELIADQASRFHIMQDINRVLLEEKKELEQQLKSLGDK